MNDLPSYSVAVIGETADEMVASAQQLEAAGYPRVWVGENRFDSYAVCSAIAATTKTVTVGTAVAIWSRSPVQATLAAASIDQISGGRFVHGIGSGPAIRNKKWHGIPYGKAGTRLFEFLTCLRLAWDSSPDRPASFSGQFYSMDGYARSHRPIRNPLPTYVGIVRPRAAEIAGELADGVLLDTNLSPRYIADVVLPAMKRGADRAGRSMDEYLVSAGMLICVDSDRRQAIEWAKHRLVSHIIYAYYRDLYIYGGFAAETAAAYEAVQRGDSAAAFNAISEEMVLAHACAGTVDDVRTQIRDWLPYVNDLRLVMPLGSLSLDEIADNQRQVMEAFPPRG